MTRFQELIARNQVAHLQRRRFVNAVMLSVTGLLTLLALVPLFWIVGYVIYRGGKTINLDFFTQLSRPLGMPGGGVLFSIEGTMVITILACLFAIPPGVLAAFYAARNPNTPLGVALRFGTDVLSGVPSIVMGLFIYVLLVVPTKHYSALAGGLALAILMLPTIIRTTEEMLKLVPHTLREGSLGLGAPEWKTSLNVVFPAALNGIITGFLLAIARAAGETAPLLFTALGNEQYDVGQDRQGRDSDPSESVRNHRTYHQPTGGLASADVVEVCPTALPGTDRPILGSGTGVDDLCSFD